MTEKRERKSNNRPFVLILAVALIGAVIAVVINLSGPHCAENQDFKDGQCVDKREVEVYTFEHDYPDKKNKHIKLTVEVPKALGYKAKENELKIELYRESDRSTVSIYAMLTSINSIAMSEEDYAKSSWADYKKTENEDGSQVVEVNRIRSDKSIFGVEWSKAYAKVVDHYWTGARVTAMASGLDQGKDSSFDGKDYKTFDARATFESEDYQYMLDSIKVEVTDISTSDED